MHIQTKVALAGLHRLYGFNGFKSTGKTDSNYMKKWRKNWLLTAKTFNWGNRPKPNNKSWANQETPYNIWGQQKTTHVLVWHMQTRVSVIACPYFPDLILKGQNFTKYKPNPGALIIIYRNLSQQIFFTAQWDFFYTCFKGWFMVRQLTDLISNGELIKMMSSLLAVREISQMCQMCYICIRK